MWWHLINQLPAHPTLLLHSPTAGGLAGIEGHQKKLHESGMASSTNHRGGGGSGGGIGTLQIGSAWFQRKINLRPQHRGVHLVTEEILRQMPELIQFSVGLCHVQSETNIFLQVILYFFFILFFDYRVSSFFNSLNTVAKIIFA